jgi:hypothetical protein
MEVSPLAVARYTNPFPKPDELTLPSPYPFPFDPPNSQVP